MSSRTSRAIQIRNSLRITRHIFPARSSVRAPMHTVAPEVTFSIRGRRLAPFYRHDEEYYSSHHQFAIRGAGEVLAIQERGPAVCARGRWAKISRLRDGYAGITFLRRSRNFR